jgi:UPF0755 protein
MSAERPGEDWLDGDPFANPDDPAAREREERRREREEKRRERAAKDAEKEAAAPPPPPPPPSEPAEPPPPPRTPEQEFWDEEPTAEEPPAAEQTPAAEQVPAEEPREEPVAVEDPLPSEPAIQQAWEFGDEGDPTKSRGGRGGRGHGGVLGGIRRHPIAVVALIFVLLVVWCLASLFQPFHGDGSGNVSVTIPKGASVSEVGELLERKAVIDGSALFGVIDASTLFQARVTLAGKRSDLYAGHFTLAKGMSYGAAIDALSTPPVKRVVTVTLPEGYSRSQAAQLVDEDGVPGSYTKATIKSRYLDPADYGGKGAKDLEGFLFPDTFELKPSAPVADLVQLQLQDFKRRIKSVDMKYARSKNLTIFDVLIIASMIEREAGVPKQRKLVASVIYNRLHEGMPLGIDATIRFATGNYSEPLSEPELEIDSPYNTRTHQGLPPGPINSPGLAAIQAAAHPAKTGYLFYVNKPNTCGELAFAKTEAEFEKNVERYEKAREANGGNEPSSC